MEIISCGYFLLDCPADTPLVCRIWGETKWLQSQGYYSLQALFLNQVELNIWFYWKRQKKDAAATIRRRGLVSRFYLVREWEKASLEQQHTVLREISSKMMGHLRDFKPVMPLQAAAAAQFQAMRHSLESLLSIITVYQSSKQRVEHSALAEVCFTCALQDAVTCPQEAVLKLLLADHLQAQCSLLLSERLSREEERLVEASRLGLAVDTLDVAADGTTVKGKGGNHSQRRGASSKKMLKLRRRQGEMHAAQKLRLTFVLREVRDFFRQKHAADAACLSDILRDFIDRAIDEDMLTPGGWRVSPQYHTKEPVHSRRKKKRKKAKMKANIALETVCTTELEIKGSSKSDHVPSPWQRPGGKKPTKPLSCHVSDEYETGARRGVTLDSDSLPFHHDLPLVDGQTELPHRPCHLRLHCTHRHSLLDRLSLRTRYFEHVLVLLYLVHRSPRLNALGDTGVYLDMQIEKMLQLLNVDKFDARSWDKWRHVVSMEIQTVLECSEGVEGQDTLPFLYSQVLVQTCVSEVDDLRAFLQTQVQARRLCAPKATPNAVVPLRKLRPLQVDDKDEDRTVEARDLLADALFKVQPTTKPVVEFVVVSVTTDVCAYVLTHLVTPRADHLVARCVARGLGRNVSHETRDARVASCQQLVTARTCP
ncbi:hypothetical protein PsorP6_012092 [Peronosclerospora sorghi]|uniref:Uncharacterized protein n=1 Tax=Peronosclerospora sorghi TaxID=230839 RepID=A0ACC0WI02_9STRA|nr:hypothetical protein PsorP6_012092 [Peronosclerospora sorghi]